MNDPEHIAISKSKGVEIDWTDGHHSSYPVPLLRDECPCALCTGSHGTTPQKTAYSAPASPFQMFQPAIKMLNVEPAGNYGLKIFWSDGHSSGIYSYDMLRRICPCSECSSR
ncbi:MAG: DUF971 domain-containing protein [Bryobacteraceae bacterium]